MQLGSAIKSPAVAYRGQGLHAGEVRAQNDGAWAGPQAKAKSPECSPAPVRPALIRAKEGRRVGPPRRRPWRSSSAFGSSRLSTPRPASGGRYLVDQRLALAHRFWRGLSVAWPRRPGRRSTSSGRRARDQRRRRASRRLAHGRRRPSRSLTTATSTHRIIVFGSRSVAARAASPPWRSRRDQRSIGVELELADKDPALALQPRVRDRSARPVLAAPIRGSQGWPDRTASPPRPPPAPGSSSCPVSLAPRPLRPVYNTFGGRRRDNHARRSRRVTTVRAGGRRQVLIASASR